MKKLLLYSLLQLPGLFISFYLLEYLESRDLIPSLWRWLLWIAWVLKDIALYFPTRRAISLAPSKDSARINGLIGVVVGDFRRSGMVRIKGELWQATSNCLLIDGCPVRVDGRDGLVLAVSPVDREEEHG